MTYIVQCFENPQNYQNPQGGKSNKDINEQSLKVIDF